MGRLQAPAHTVTGVADPLSSDQQWPEQQWERFDLRRPTKLSREQLRAFDLFHDTFSRRLSSGMGRLARATATVEIVRTSQLSWDEYLRTLPGVTTLITASAPPLPGELLIEMDTSLSLALAGRLLGGAGRMEPPRHPSELEVPALHRIGSTAVDALGDAFGQFLDVSPMMEAVDLSPQLLATAAPSQVVLVLTFNLAVPLLALSGDFGVVIPLSTLSPLLERLLSHSADRLAEYHDPSVMQEVAERIPVVLQATLQPIRMSAVSVAGLTPGDVIVLDHRVGQPASMNVGGVELLKGHLGRRGARLAIAVSEHPFADPPPAPAPMMRGAVAPAYAGPDPAVGPHGYGHTVEDNTHVLERVHA